jgi:hypothetical protein
MRNLCLNQFFRNGNHFQEAFSTKKLVSSQHVRHSGDREGSQTFNQRAQNLPANWASRRAGPRSEPTTWHWGEPEERLTSLVNDRISALRKDMRGMDFERKLATANQFSRRLPLRQFLTELPGLRVDPSISALPSVLAHATGAGGAFNLRLSILANGETLSFSANTSCIFPDP